MVDIAGSDGRVRCRLVRSLVPCSVVQWLSEMGSEASRAAYTYVPH